MCFHPQVPRLLQLSNDVEQNPGPLPHKLIRPGQGGPNRKQPMKLKEPETRAVEGQRESNNGLYSGTSVEDLRYIIDKQNDQIMKQNDEIKSLKKKIDDNEKVVSDFRSELSEVRKKWQSMGDLRPQASNSTSQYGSDESALTKIESLVLAYNDIQDRLYEIDKSWKNNLIFYGIPIESNLEDEDPYATEEKVRELIKRKLRITREIPFNRVTRVVHGPEFRGHKPVQVHFANYNDKEDVLRKAKLLKGAGVHISEDFSRKVREHRQELNKFMKEVRARDPARRMFLRYDKLYMGNDVFFYNDKSGRVERLHSQDNNSYNSSLVDSVFTSDAQLAHDWGRRPRSKYSSRSRPITPVQALSRQNSMSMDDISQDEFYGTPKPTPMRSRPVTGRSRDRVMAKSVSIESLQYEHFQQSGSPSKAKYQQPDDIRKISERYLSSPQKQPEYYSQKPVNGHTNNSGNSRHSGSGKQKEPESDDTDRTSPEETQANKTPEPTFVDEPRYSDPPETPKKSPVKADSNPLLRLAVPRSARSARERKISFKDEREEERRENSEGKNINESDFSDDEEEQDEVLSLEVESKTFSQELRESCKSSNFCTDLVPVLPAISKSSTELVPVERVEIKPLTRSKYPASWSSLSPTVSVTSSSQSSHQNYSGFPQRGQSSSGSLRQIRDSRQSLQSGSSGGVLKLNVAIAGEFSMGNFGNNQQQ